MCARTRTHTYTHTHAHTHVRTHTYAHMHTHTYLHMHMHTQIHTQDPSYGYGATGSFSFPSVPPASLLTYEVEMVGFEEPQQADESVSSLHRLKVLWSIVIDPLSLYLHKIR